VAVTDSGSWREGREPVGELPGARGRGLGIIEGLMDTAEVAPGPRGTTVTMRRRLGARGDAVRGAGNR
jgi:anti-sigma regulatory factor (Ser/Thr protein kinase)